jgi:hypothetical protein
MLRRSVLSLLAGVLIILAPIVTASQDTNAVAAADSPTRFRSPLPRSRHSVREPIHRVRRFPRNSAASSGFPQLVHSAATIFSGTVTRVQPRPANAGQSVATVAITFHIENAILGAVPGRDLSISEWMGLWSSGQRYRVGERVLLFLYPRSKLGLTSSVAGAMGRFTADTQGGVLLSPLHMSAFRTHPVVGGKSRLRLSDFALAVKQATGEE